MTDIIFMPDTLGQVAAGELSGFQSVEAFYLERTACRRGSSLAVITGTEEVVVCLNEELLMRVRELLPQRLYRISKLQLMVNIQGGYGFDLRFGQKAKVFHIFTEEYFSRLVYKETPFSWAHGPVHIELMEAQEFIIN